MKSDTSSELEILIHERVAGRIALAPLWLSTLLGEIDYRQREVARLDDLNAALRRLVARGLIRELPGHTYVDGRSSGGVSVHAEISRSAYRRSLSQARAALTVNRRTPSGSLDSLNDAKLFAVIPTSKDRESSRSEWQRVEELAMRICEVLAEEGRQVVVRTLRTSGDHIEFWVLGSERDEPDQMLKVVAPIFATMTPAGSSLTVASDL